MPEVDLFIGTGQYHRITELLDKHGKALQLGAPLPQRSYVDQPAFIHTEKDPRLHTGPNYSAYLKLSEGCNRRCAFCIIPKLRGNVRSRTVESLVNEAKQLASQGVRELNLVAQDLTEYGMEWKYKERLETLLPELCKVEGIEWIRLHYVYPDQFSDELVEYCCPRPKIVKYLDMPIQHTNDRVLKSMNRRLTKTKLFDSSSKNFEQKFQELFLELPSLLAFPVKLKKNSRTLPRSRSLTQARSRRRIPILKRRRNKGREMSDQVHPATKTTTSKETHRNPTTAVFRESAKICWSNYHRVMIEGPSEETELLIQGRMPTQAQEIDGHVLINDLGDFTETQNLNSLKPGMIVQVEITEALPHDLMGRIVRAQ